MTEDIINLEINGRPAQARKGQMIIEVADAANIRIPRFCYHKKLTVAANCRMCLVEVEKAPKPVPACAWPVAEGMKVFTHSPKAIDAQKGTMEFLLINHPLDCPICDQGGECELQDVAMGYGQDISRYTENKRVVKDKDIGPLISTDMTRCIHCTRCVRFGAEIAGVRELGATGRGEFMEIGTYIEKAVGSELSGNVIDLCPVGALNAKPSRFAARAWEMVQHASVSPHDCIGSNLYLHTLRGRVIRAVPRDFDAINETWLTDRDRFSYQGLYSQDRLPAPMIKRRGEWRKTGWETALAAVAAGLRRYAAEEVGILASASATLEEFYLLQKLARGIGTNNIDHRLRQTDFSDQQDAPLFPWLGQSIEDLERLDAVLLIGSDIRKEQPMAAHRLRKASLRGADIMVVNPRDFGFHFRVAGQAIRDPRGMLETLAGITKAVLQNADKAPRMIQELLAGIEPDETAKNIAGKLKNAGQASILLGVIAIDHPHFALLRTLASLIAEQTGARLGYLPDGANGAGAWLAGCVPHRRPAGTEVNRPGLHVKAMLEQPRKAYLLFGLEPEFDCDNPSAAKAAMQTAEFVTVCTPFASETMKAYADVLLPTASFAETAGTFVNAEGRWQSVNAAIPPPAEARPGWKLLRVLGNALGLDGFDYTSAEQVRDELKARFPGDPQFDNRVPLSGALRIPQKTQAILRVSAAPIYAVDPLVRRAKALQQTSDARDVAVRINSGLAKVLRLSDAAIVTVCQDAARAVMPLIIDDGVADGCAWMPAGIAETTALGSAFGEVTLEHAEP